MVLYNNMDCLGFDTITKIILYIYPVLDNLVLTISFSYPFSFYILEYSISLFMIRYNHKFLLSIQFWIIEP